MSVEERYGVEVELILKDADFARGLRRVQRDMDASQREALSSLRDRTSATAQAFVSFRQSALGLAHGIGGSVVGALDQVAAKTFSIARTMGAAGGAALFAGATYGVLKLNAGLESAKIGLAAIFSAQGVTKDVPSGIAMASEQIAKMKQDAKELPGEFEDLQNIYKLGMTAAVQAGQSPDQHRGQSAKVMAAAVATGVDIHQAAREYAQLLQGRSGAHNVFGTMLGISGEKSEKFNKASGKERVATLGVELEKYAPAIKAFGDTFDAQSSTFVDAVKQLATTATGPLFERVKDTLKDINNWMSANGEELSTWATNFGLKLAKAWDYGREVAEEWWPILKEFGGNLWEGMKKTWEQIAPAVERAAAAVKEFLKDPKSVDRLITLAKLYLALKVGQAGMGGLSAIGGQAESAGLGLASAAAGPAGLMGKAGGMGGAVSGLMGGGGGAGGDDGGGASFGGGGGFGSSSVGLGVILAATSALAPFAAMLYGGTKIIDAYSQEHARAKTEMTAFVASLTDLDEGNMRLSAKMSELEMAGDEAAIALLQTAVAAREAAEDLANIANTYGKNRSDEIADRWGMGAGLATGAEALKKLDEKQNKKSGGGHGGTSIQKVEIVVTSNQDPSRIALMVTDQLQKLNRNKRASKFTRNYSSVT